MTTSDGYSVQAEVDVYRPAHADNPPMLPYTSRQGVQSCTFNATTDAVIPVSFTPTNTTSNFPATLGLVLNADASASSGGLDTNALQADTVFSSGPSCSSLNDGSSTSLYNVHWDTATSPGGVEYDAIYLVVPNYYTPAHPDGNTALLRGVVLDIGPTINQNGGTTIPETPTVHLYTGVARASVPTVHASRALTGYLHEVAALLRDSAATRKQLVAAIAEKGSDPAAARSAIAAVVSTRENELAEVTGMTAPSAATAAHAALTRAFRLSLASDRDYQQWVDTGSHAAYQQAQGNDVQTVAAKTAFLRRYNVLRASAGLPTVSTSLVF